MQKRTLLMTVAMAIAFLFSLAWAIAATPTGNMNRPSTNNMSLEETLRDWTIQSLDYLQEENGEIKSVVKLDQEQYMLSLRPYSLRSADFRVEFQVEGGEYVDYVPSSPSTYRGTVEGIPGSVVAASLIKGQLAAIIDLGQDDFWFIEPLSKYDNQAEDSDYVVYRASDTLPIEGHCGNDYIEIPDGAGFDLPDVDPVKTDAAGEAGLPASRAEELCEVAFDTDWEYYRFTWDRDPEAVVTDIEYIMNGVEVVYQRDVEICYNITHIIIRTTSDDPYEGDNASQILNQFRNHWFNNQGDIQRDVAHLMVGRALSGGVLGVSYLSSICGSYWGYGLSKTKFVNNYDQRVTLTTHEMGHNWSATHCDGDPDCHIMCSMLGGCMGIGLPNFGSRAIGEILNHKSTRTCLEDGCGEVLDLIEPDPGIGGQVSTLGVRGAAPGATVKFYFTIPSGSWEVPECPGLYLDIGTPKKDISRTADSDGSATISMTVPDGMSGRTLLIQAADITSCEKSDVEDFSFE